ncbi:hypothetical protein GCM10023159_10320 [Brevibacterium yomogidense]
MTGAAARSERPGGTPAWGVVSAFDVFTASLRGESTWPTVLRPASVAQRLEDGLRAAQRPRASSEGASGGMPTGDGDSGGERIGGGSSGSGERLCALALPIAESTQVRAVHWYRGVKGTVIAETACGPETSVVLVGWAPYDPGLSGEVRTLPGALLLGIFDTGLVAGRLAELVGESTAPADTVVVGRWSLPEGCPPMAVRSVVHPQPGVLRRELVAQLTEALCRVQAHAADRLDTDGRAEGPEASR